MKRRKGRERGFDDGETEGAERFKLAHLQQNVHRPHPAPFFFPKLLAKTNRDDHDRDSNDRSVDGALLI